MDQAVPSWLLRPLPANAVEDAALLARIDELAARLPGSLGQLHQALTGVAADRKYDAAANRACVHVWQALPRIWADGQAAALFAFARDHLPEQARHRILRRLAKHPAYIIRSRVRKLILKGQVREVALPARTGAAWDATGWLTGLEPLQRPESRRRLFRHPQGQRAQERQGVPALANLAELRQLLDIRSPSQLGYLLLASAMDGGPYRSFTIPKRDGSARSICAPKPQLRWVQRQILDKILAPVSAHAAAHGFVVGRSIVTNAEPHQGAELIVKFDLENFFPTIHYYRVLGLFARLGYQVGNGRFGTADDSPQVAPTLARLCCYTPDPRSWGTAFMPQGAPTSPAISNLVCRRLDARLVGLARRNGGVYTRYADDLTFSFKQPPPLGRLRWWVDQVCHQEGFAINQSKFRVIRRAQRQLVTGIVVNDTLRVRREERRRFRAILHNCEKHGLESQAHGNPAFGQYLRGFACFLHMVQPEEGEGYLRRVAALLGQDGAEGTS